MVFIHFFNIETFNLHFNKLIVTILMYERKVKFIIGTLTLSLCNNLNNSMLYNLCTDNIHIGQFCFE